MKMNHKQALEVLGLWSNASYEDVKQAYRRLSMKYHPDRNPAGEEMMKLINGAYQALSDYVAVAGVSDKQEASYDIPDALNAALNAVINLEGIVIEICGSWIWLSGNTKEHRLILKEAGYKYAPKKVMWSFCGGKRSTSRGKFSMDDIRSRHGSAFVRAQGTSRARIDN